ncbi:MAG: HIT domain-containing protein [Candidatus Pacearchaeota archaeon]
MIENCIFCKISRGSSSSSNLIYENDNFFSILDKQPWTEGHSLVISKKHFETSLDLPNSLGSELLDCLKHTALLITKKNKAEGFHILQNNFEAADQIVKHAHFHVIPRKKGDGKDFKQFNN